MDRETQARLGLLLMTCGALVSCASPQHVAKRKSRYFDQTPPSVKPEVFAPGVVSTPDAVELNGVFSPDFTEFFFTRASVQPVGSGGGVGVFRIHRSVWDPAMGWMDPEPVQVWPGDAASLAVDMAYSLDGSRLYFLGRHPHARSPTNPGSDIWVCERRSDGRWSLASPLPPPVWSAGVESYPAVTPGGSLQFSSDRPGGHGSTDLWRAAPKPGGDFDTPVNMGPRVNSEFGEGDSCAAIDDSYIVFTSRRPGGPGNGDLYVSFRDADSSEWTEPKLLGHGVNTADTDYCPMITPDGRFLMFSRRVSDPKDGGWDHVVAGDVYWISTDVIEAMRP